MSKKPKNSSKSKGIHLNVDYPRMHIGPLTGKYIHRIVAEALLHRRLNKNETVDHKDQNPFNFDPSNLQILSWKNHGRLTRWRERRQLILEGILHKDFEIILDGEEIMKTCPIATPQTPNAQPNANG